MSIAKGKFDRRSALAWTARAVSATAWFGLIGASLMPGRGHAAVSGRIEPEEKVEETIKRLFGDKKIQDGSSFMKLDAPLIAENGAVVPIKLDTTVDPTPQKHVKTVYFVVDKNRRPMSASFSFAPEAGRVSVGTNLRLGATSDIRAIAVMNDGSIFAVKRDIKVTVGGCGG